MRCFIYPQVGNPDTLTMIERDIPKPGPGQVLVRMKAASLNYRDHLISTGRYGTPDPNLVPLSDGAGEVVEVGAGVTGFSAGDRVVGCFFETWLGGRMVPEHFEYALGGTAQGVLAEYKVFSAQALLPIPGELSFHEAATLPCAALTAWNALFEYAAPVRPGETVLILGTGGVSMFALQFAKAAGAEALATSSSDAKLAKAQSLGASTLINYRTHPEWDEEVRKATGGRGVDHVVEVGGAGTLQRSIGAACHGGAVHLIGVLTGGTINPFPILFNTTHVRGVFVGSKEMFGNMNRMITLHGIRPVIDRVFPFAEARSATRYMEGASHVGKIVIEFG